METGGGCRRQDRKQTGRPADRETRSRPAADAVSRTGGRSVAAPADRRRLGQVPPGASCPAAGIFSGKNSVKKIREKNP